MKEITELKTNKKQLSAKHTYYYNGCDTIPHNPDNEDTILPLAADVLIQMLTSKRVANQRDPPLQQDTPNAQTEGG